MYYIGRLEHVVFGFDEKEIRHLKEKQALKDVVAWDDADPETDAAVDAYDLTDADVMCEYVTDCLNSEIPVSVTVSNVMMTSYGGGGARCVYSATVEGPDRSVVERELGNVISAYELVDES